MSFDKRQLLALSKKKTISGRCNFKLSIRKGTWFHQSRLSLKQIVLFTNMWLILSSSRQKLITEELDISSRTFVDWSSFCREVCMEWAAERSHKLGGPGKIVEIDEAKFGKRKYHRGRKIEGQWILGGVERDSKKSFYVPVARRDAATLIGVIKDWIFPGTTIYSDCWKAYGGLKNEGFQHLTVNHSTNFVDPSTGAHIQNVERSWRNLRTIVPRYGKKSGHYDGYLAAFQFKRKYHIAKQRLHHFLKIAGQMYAHGTPSSEAVFESTDDPIPGTSGVETAITSPTVQELDTSDSD